MTNSYLTENQFQNLKLQAQSYRLESHTERIQRLKKLKKAIQNHESVLIESLKKDFSKPTFETTLSELIPVYHEIDFTIKNLKHWMQDVHVPTPITLIGHSSRIRFENKGVVLIIAPWNYPVYLTLAPLITALAAGNSVVIKPSELTPNTSNELLNLIQQTFSDNEVTVVLGDKSATERLLTFQFDHVFFTGSTPVGRIIAKTCAEKLIPVTLELGGKSPVIIDETADIQDAAEKIFWGKFLNRAQTCVAPDYIMIHESIHDLLISELKKLNTKHQSNIEGKIITERHEKRLLEMTDSKKSFAENILEIKQISDLNDSSMKDELFGPILPILKFKNISDIKMVIHTYDKPLALYVFSKNNTFVDLILRTFSSGGVAINTVIMHLANPYLPFGGVGASGQGRYHGYHGFKELSHERAILKTNIFYFLFKKMNSLFYPPYSNFKLKVLNLIK